MQKILKNPRNGCAFQGALQTIQAIKNTVPVVHSTAGCAYQSYLAGLASGSAAPFIRTDEVPGTNMQERHIIFGGASRLREQIKNTLKVIDGKLYVVLNSCPSAMVGDDVDAMVREVQEQGEKVIDGLSAGFHGDVHYGYQQILTEIFQNLPKIENSGVQKEGNLVNIFGIIPQKDIFYKGDLAEIKRILSSLGIKTNTFFGKEDGSEELLKAKNASLNIVFSRWGKAPADKLTELYSIPTISFDSIPLGLDETAEFLKKVADSLNLDFAPAQAFLEEEAADFAYYFSSLREAYYENHLAKSVDIVGDEASVVKYSGFLKKYFGSEIATAIITDFFPSDDNPESAKAESLKNIAEKVYFAQDSTEIQGLLRYTESSLILASSLEEGTAEKKQAPIILTSYPAGRKVILNRTHAGIRGAVEVAESLANS